ncbi:MAG: hypothetical protein FWE71_01115 [Nocardioidaceae bacterium]|nr:hypothetical protein [Nocardioidaceae bacterium]MCL2612723.1 hypothetical protein [Nocardioidaceae bacterium]
MSVNGLPLHPLVVHATVVALPVSAVLAVAYVASPKWQERLRWPLAIMGVVSAVLMWVTVSSGKELEHAISAGGPVAALIDKHRAWAGRLQVATYVFTVLAVGAALLDKRAGWLKGLLHALLVVGAVTIVVFSVLTGDAGAQAAWYGIHS